MEDYRLNIYSLGDTHFSVIIYIENIHTVFLLLTNCKQKKKKKKKINARSDEDKEELKQRLNGNTEQRNQ